MTRQQSRIRKARAPDVKEPIQLDQHELDTSLKQGVTVANKQELLRETRAENKKVVVPDIKQESRIALRRVRLFALLLAFPPLLITVFWFVFVFPSIAPLKDVPAMPLTVGVEASRYVAVGDESVIKLTIKNNGDKPISGSVIIDMSGDSPLRTVSGQTSKADFELGSRVITTEEIKFRIVKEKIAFFSGERIPLNVLVNVQGETSTVPLDARIEVGPVPYTRTVLNYVLGLNFLAALGTFFWNQFQKHVLKDKTEE